MSSNTVKRIGILGNDGNQATNSPGVLNRWDQDLQAEQTEHLTESVLSKITLKLLRVPPCGCCLNARLGLRDGSRLESGHLTVPHWQLLIVHYKRQWKLPFLHKTLYRNIFSLLKRLLLVHFITRANPKLRVTLIWLTRETRKLFL